MSLNPIYRFDLIDANTMRNMPVGIGAATSRAFKPEFGAPGTFTYQLPIDDAAAGVVRNYATGVIIFRNGRAIWSGETTDVVHSAKSGTTSVTTTGWLDELEHRYVRKSEESTLAFASPGVVGGEIFRTLVDTVNAQQDTGLVARPTRLTFDAATDVQTRITSYKQGASYGASWRQLRDVEDGFDVSVDPLTRKISTRDPGTFVDRKNVVFAYGVKPSNLDDVVQTLDGKTIANRETVVGSSSIAISADDTAAIESAGIMLEEWQSMNSSQSSIVGAFANAELVYKRYGLITYQLTPSPYGDIPRPYDDFEWGDKGYLSVSRGALQVRDQAIRLFSATITIDNAGNEIISDLMTTAS